MFFEVDKDFALFYGIMLVNAQTKKYYRSFNDAYIMPDSVYYLKICNNFKTNQSDIDKLGADPAIKIFKENNKLANMRLAVNDRYKNANGEWIDETQWFSLVAWTKLAEYAEKYLLKGVEVAIEGRLVNKTFTDKNAVKRISTDIIVSEILILSKKAAVAKELV